MRYILIILVFLSVGANAQMVIKAHANYRPYASPAVNLLLDDYPNASVAYSLRKLDKDYAGSAIRVRRSNDNTEQDIGFTAGGDLDTATLKTFVGANSGFVVTWYDQSGNARNATQGGSALQPRVVNGGVIERRSGNIALVFDGANDFLENATNGFSVNNVSHYAVSSRGNDANAVRTIYSTGILAGANGFGFLYNSNDPAGTQNRLYQQIRSTTTVQGIGVYINTINTNNLIFGIGTSTTDFTYYNGGNEQTINHTRGNVTSTGRIIIGARYDPANYLFYLNGTTTEIVFWNANQSSNRTGIENNINDYYNLYWNGDFTGLLDTYPSSAAAYSLRNLSSTYTGPLIRVRRSNDNAEQDIFGDYYGNLDTVGLKNFVGANSGFVTTWYDQSGNARNATQSTAANQPRIMNAGVLNRVGGKLTIRAEAAQRFGTPDLGSTIFTTFLSLSRSNTTNDAILLKDGSNYMYLHYGNTVYIGDATISNVTLNTNQTLITLRRSNSVPISSVYRNNALQGSTTSVPNNAYFTQLPSAQFRSSTVFMNELILYYSDQISNISNINTNINNYWSIY